MIIDGLRDDPDFLPAAEDIGGQDAGTVPQSHFVGLDVIVGQIATDLSYGLVDPRVRFE